MSKTKNMSVPELSAVINQAYAIENLGDRYMVRSNEAIVIVVFDDKKKVESFITHTDGAKISLKAKEAKMIARQLHQKVHSLAR